MQMGLHSAATPINTKTKILKLKRIVANVVEAQYRKVESYENPDFSVESKTIYDL